MTRFRRYRTTNAFDGSRIATACQAHCDQSATAWVRQFGCIATAARHTSPWLAIAFAALCGCKKSQSPLASR